MNSAPTRPDQAAKVGRIISDLRARFVAHDGYARLRHEFDTLLYRRRADLEAHRSAEARGIVVVGASGSGKSTAIQRLLRKHPAVTFLAADRIEADVASLLVPSPATLKSVGLACLTGLGYPLRRDRTAMIIWELVQNHLHQRKVLFLHLDEVQDLHVNRSASERQAVVNTLKSLMQNPMWPVGLLLSGTTDLKELVNLDPQLSRRLVPVEFPQISFASHGGEIETVLQSFAGIAGLIVTEELTQTKFLRRLIHSADSELGLVIEVIIAGIEDALLRGQEVLDISAFTRAFRRRSGAADAINPFLSDDWQALNTRLLLQSVEREDLMQSTGRRQR